jgi:ornithine cyclodeaminase/alanine dehydrogenase
MKTRILTQSEVRSLIAIEQAVDAVAAAFAAHGRGETLMPVKVYLDLARHDGDFRAMPAYFDGAAGVKWVNSHPNNPERYGLPSVIGTYILSDPETAQPLAILDATFLTAARTGAAAAVATRHLARHGARSVGLIGCGAQARTLLAALEVVLGKIELVAFDRAEQAARALVEELGGRSGTIEEAAGCDVVCTATPSRVPIVMRDWIRPGTHINAMGADAHGKQELEPAILLDAKVVVDDWEQAGESGEVNVPLAQEVLEPDQIYATLGAICAGHKPGRTSDEEITVFDSTGLAVQDVALARLVYRRALEEGVGLEVDLRS